MIINKCDKQGIYAVLRVRNCFYIGNINLCYIKTTQTLYIAIENNITEKICGAYVFSRVASMNLSHR